MTPSRIIGIGETVFDILFKNNQPQKAVPGGSTFNSIVSLGRAGMHCAMVTEAGGDHVGDLICNTCAATQTSNRTSHWPSSMSITMPNMCSIRIMHRYH